MFGFHSFGAAPFGGLVAQGLPVIAVSGALQAGQAEISGGVDLNVFLGGALQAAPASLLGSVVIPDALLDAVLQAQSAVVYGLVRRHQVSGIDWSGEADMEFVGTTKFIDMIESGDALLGIAAEIRLRSL